MKPVHTEKEVESAARKATEALYGGDIEAFRIRTLLPFPNEQNREAWDAQVTFLLVGRSGNFLTWRFTIHCRLFD